MNPLLQNSLIACVMLGQIRQPLVKLLALAWAAAALPAAAAPLESAVQQELAVQASQLRVNGGLYVQGLAMASGGLLPAFYAARHYAPVWTRQGRIDELLDLLATAESHGLRSKDYYLADLRSLRQRVLRSDEPALAASLDLSLTESLIRFVYHQRLGKVDSRSMQPIWNFTRPLLRGQDPLRTLTDAVGSPSLAVFAGQWRERAPLYRALQDKLAEYRDIAASGGWPMLPAGPALHPGAADPRLALLRERLVITGDLPSTTTTSGVYAEELVAGVRRFQVRHELDASGVLDAGTLAAMNVPVSARIEQLRLTLERARWVQADSTGEVVVVNVAGYEVFAWRNGSPFWRRRAVVGMEARETPAFNGSMTYLELNPAWIVPPTVLREDLLPKIRLDPEYPRSQNISVLDRNGQLVDAAAIDWQAVGDDPPYIFRQEPGPRNVLGRIKFMFPNAHAVYLHDTPSRELFEQTPRNFGSGCIRVEDPLSLAEIVLADPQQWNRSTLEAAIATGETRKLSLPRPWPVLILYWTAELDSEGHVRFLPDAYRRDPPVLEALNGDVVIDYSTTARP